MTKDVRSLRYLVLVFSDLICYVNCRATATVVASKEDIHGTNEKQSGVNSLAPSSSSTDISFNFSILNGTGHDISDGFTIFYPRQTAPSTRSRKRVVSRAINDCPNNHRFLYWNHGSQTWSLVCRAQAGAPQGSSLHWGECDTAEFCINGRSIADVGGKGYVESTAWCVDHANILQVSELLAGGKTAGSVQVGFNAVAGRQNSIEAVLTSSDAHSSIKARSMEIQAQRADVIGNVQSWRTLNAGDQRCSGCASVRIVQVPVGTQRITAHIELMPQTLNGLLYLLSV